ncbi:hypothetical protein RI367_004852 [Sorochytrium milnesiophthora]
MPPHALAVDQQQQRLQTDEKEAAARAVSPLSIGIPRYYTPNEVAQHCESSDLWVSWLGNVYNLTPLAEENDGNPKLYPILLNAGKDISHWFDRDTGTLKTFRDPRTNLTMPVCPDGEPLHVPPVTEPVAHWTWEVAVPWWIDCQRYWIGKLSAKTRMIRIVNTLTKEEITLEVCSEEPVSAIVERYLAAHNSHAKGYSWKRLGTRGFELLDMTLTLQDNGVEDESDTMGELGMVNDDWLPALYLYFMDDLTVA